ncbi:MAG: hypothetical protein ACLUSP_05035 [Christensenellales bacterium]
MERYVLQSLLRRPYYPNDDAKLDVDALEGIPKNVRLVYWDYYHAEPKFYDRMIKMHRQIGNEISFAAARGRGAVLPDLTTSANTLPKRQ